ncbi:amino acid ABC transporter membrane protein, PAAT family [Hathewaya proteolytica DSM 3090]|uniref:Amino acid ABC transporter membrane protein, PAAT family n=1 Tax=Hathewaya proteolytica DSM 3090 TaxID=1121331 RepID=A0A1M6QZS3_9CLOT|nr:amino acid ABC transporter permease [Hathewaya proteolytica]SHK25636.1 amino acid ABC transporter membrane protein, PAAT family [Hathewaya proteolytica DSM 3090]
MFDYQYALKILPKMLIYLKTTLMLASLSMLFGLTIAIILSILLNKNNKILNKIIAVYISFFRGTPIIAQLFLVYLGFVQIIPSLKAMTNIQAAIIVFSLASSAFMTETIRGAILSVNKGQMEAAMSVGMTYGTAMRRIIFPQAIRLAIPSLSNTFINLIKDSSVAFTIGVTEMIAAAQMEATSSWKYLEAFVDIIIVYWILVSLLTYLQNILERNLQNW